MARASVIYVVRYANGCIEHGFTVKYELLNWLQKTLKANPKALFDVIKVPDGGDRADLARTYTSKWCLENADKRWA